MIQRTTRCTSFYCLVCKESFLTLSHAKLNKHKFEIIETNTVWVGLESLKKELEKLRLFDCHRNHKCNGIIYCDRCEIYRHIEWSLCKSPEQNLTKGMRESSVSGEQTGEEITKSGVNLANGKSSPVHNQKKCTCKLKRINQNTYTKKGVCRRCGGVLCRK